MKGMKSIYDVVQHHGCMSCGLCFSAMETAIIDGQQLPVKEKKGKRFDFSLCPGKGYDLSVAAEQKKYSSFLLGGWESIHAVRSKNLKILENAASGGIMTAIASKTLELGLADYVIVTKLVCKNGKITPETFAASAPNELIQAQGSKYMPVAALSNIRNLIHPGKKYVYIGTPCQIAGIRALQKTDPLFRDGIVLTIGNFCGGFRDLRERDSIFHQLHIQESDVEEFAYRRGTQPGYMLIRLRNGLEYHLPYPFYSKMTGYIPLRRCRLCIDATAELADFSCGDAWLKRFQSTGKAWSILISRSRMAEKMLTKLKAEPSLLWDTISEEEIFAAQKGNLTSKKKRQFARRDVYALCGCKLPMFNLPRSNVSMKDRLFEIKVMLSHGFFTILQKLGCYSFIAKIIKRNHFKIEVINEN